MIRVRVLDTAGNVFSFLDVPDNETAFKLVTEWVIDGFRVEVVSIPPPPPYLTVRVL